MKVGSLFSGIGGFDEGFHRAGFDVIWQVEKDEACQRVLKRHYPKAEMFNDVKNISAASLEPVDCVVGGFPCQDLSVAGKRAGLAGERSGLWFEFYRIIAGAKPRFVVVENVPGLLSSEGGRDFGVIVRGLLDLGYCIAWRVLDAQHFGLAQRRKRVFIVGSLGNGSCAQVLFEPESSAWNSPPRREAGQRVAACIDGSPYADREAEDSRLVGVPDVAWALQERDAKGADSADSDTKDGHLIVAAPLTTGMSRTKGVNPPGRRKEDDVNLVCATLSCGNSGGFRTEPGEHLVAHALRSEGADASEDGTGRGTLLVAFNIIGSGQEGKNHVYETSVTGAIQHKGNSASGNEAGTVVFESRLARNGRGAPSEIAPLAAGGFGVRRLTPTECERLQGFPDGWTVFDAEGNSISDSARYRMLGNAVAVPVAEWIARRITAL